MFKNIKEVDVRKIRTEMLEYDSDLDTWTNTHGKMTSEGLLWDRSSKMTDRFNKTIQKYDKKTIDIREDIAILRKEWYDIEMKWRAVIDRKMC